MTASVFMVTVAGISGLFACFFNQRVKINIYWRIRILGLTFTAIKNTNAYVRIGVFEIW